MATNKAKITSLKRTPAYQMAEEALREMIMDATLAPGELLPVEHDLAEQLAVTRPTVREALRKLESSGLVVRGPRRRMMVSAPSPKITAIAMKQAIIMHGISLRELWELCLAIEPAAAAMAAERINTDLLGKIESNLERTEKFIDQPIKLIEADIEFHGLLVAASGNQALALAHAPLADAILPSYAAMFTNLDPGKRLLQAHTKIFEGLQGGDVELAREWAANHIRDFMRGCEMAGVPVDGPIRNRKDKIAGIDLDKIQKTV